MCGAALWVSCCVVVGNVCCGVSAVAVVVGCGVVSVAVVGVVAGAVFAVVVVVVVGLSRCLAES